MKQEKAGGGGGPGAFSFLVSLMDSVPLPLFVADFSPLRSPVDRAGPGGFSYRELFATQPEERDRIASQVKIIHSNEEGGRFLGGRSLPGRPEPVWMRFDDRAWDGLGLALDSFVKGATRAEFPIAVSPGLGGSNQRTIRLEIPDFASDSWSHAIVCLVDPLGAPGPWSTVGTSIDSDQLFENMTVGFALHEMIFDGEGRPLDYRFLQVNRAFERLTGLARGGLLGRRVREVLPGTEESWFEAYASVVLTGQPLFVHDYSAVLERWYDVWAYRPSTGRFATMIQDVTEAHNKEELIRAQGERLDMALDATGAGLWELELSSGCLMVDSRWEDLLGYAPGTFPGSLEAWEGLCNPSDLATVRTARALYLSGEKERYACELRLRDREGRERWFLDRGRVSSRDGEGQAIRVVGTLVNIDRRKLAEIAEAVQRSRLSSLLDSLDDLVYFKDREGRYLGVNRAFEDFFGLGSEQLIGHTAEQFFPPGLSESIREQVGTVVSREASLKAEEWHTAQDGRRVLFEKKLSPLRDSEGGVVGVAGISRDVTARFDAQMQSGLKIRVLERARDEGGRDLARFALEEALGASRSSLAFLYTYEAASSSARLLAGTTDLPLSLSLEGTEACAECLRVGPSIRNDLGGQGHTAIHDLARGLFVPIRRGVNVLGFLGMAREDPPYDNRDLGLLANMADQIWDLLQARMAEEKLAESDRSKDATLEVTKAGLWTWYVREGRWEYDDHWARLVGLSLAQVKAMSLEEIKALIHPDDLGSCLASRQAYLAGDLAIYESELRLHHADGRWIWVLDRGEVLERDSNGRAIRMAGLTVDINRIKATEERLRETVADKEALLRELYHRTNNSMQLISAMLEFKKAELSDQEALRSFEEIQSKIIAMALVQEKIYRSGNLSTIDLGDYLSELVERLREEEEGRSVCPRFQARVKPVSVAVDSAIPCGIIVSELIANSLRHAFAEGLKGEVGLALDKAEDGTISLEVWDNGRGLAPGFNPRTSSHLGLRTVIGIGEEQLRGKVAFEDRKPGLSVSLHFKNDYIPRRL